MINILQRAAIEQANFTAMQAMDFQYQTLTTYWSDFTIADVFGKKAIKDTYKQACLNKDVKMFTELVIVLNHKCWYYWERKNEELSKLYADLYHQAAAWAGEHFRGEDYEYYFRITD